MTNEEKLAMAIDIGEGVYQAIAKHCQPEGQIPLPDLIEVLVRFTCSMAIDQDDNRESIDRGYKIVLAAVLATYARDLKRLRKEQ